MLKRTFVLEINLPDDDRLFEVMELGNAVRHVSREIRYGGRTHGVAGVGYGGYYQIKVEGPLPEVIADANKERASCSIDP